LKHNHSSATADHAKTTGHSIKWDHLDILASGKTDYRCKVKDCDGIFIQDLQPALSANLGSEKLLLQFTESFRLKFENFYCRYFSV